LHQAQCFDIGRTMKHEPNIAAIAALIGDPARANILAALMDGRALTISELAGSADIGLPTASAHVAKLEEAGLLASLKQGRNRYVRLSGADVAHTLESLMLLASRTGHQRVRTGPRDPALREARICYDHLAGARGVQLLESMVIRNQLSLSGDTLKLTKTGRHFIEKFGIEVEKVDTQARSFCISCLDWSERREHLAGRLGAAIFARLIEMKWARRDAESRAVIFNQNGLAAFNETFPV
jgi:DNA-binding transcriptional ArsR family regulator